MIRLNWIRFIVHYTLALFIANFSVGMLTLIYKLLLITVQGPTMFTRISEIGTYYIVFSTTVYLLFRRYGRRQQSVNYKEMVIFFSLVLLIHAMIILVGRWNLVWTVTTGSIQLIGLIYSGGENIESLRDIPRLYYYIALTIEDACLMIFSSLGVLRKNY